MPNHLPSLCLEYGADEERCERGLEICERGMCFHSRWQFSSGTQVGISLCYRDCSGEPQRARLEGIVVECQLATDCPPGMNRCYKVTLLFVDVPEALLHTIRDVASLLDGFRPPAPIETPLPAPSVLVRRSR